jgi:carbon-monoxide dehydrogenase medium subunit
MIATAFDYYRPTSVNEAIEMMKEHGDSAKILAGGHSLIPSIKLRLNSPEKLIDISQLEDLKYIREDGDVIAIGAGTTHGEIAKSDLLKQHVPILPEAAELIGDPAVRNLGTIGGSLAHADPAADWPASLLALEAEVVLQGPNGKRTVPMSDFFMGIFFTALEENELIVELRIPKPPKHTGWAYVKFSQPASRYALVGCAALVTKGNGKCDRVRVAFTGVSDVAFRDTAVEDALTGKDASEDAIANAADQAAGSVDIMEDHFASEKYRKHLAKVFAKRALQQAAERT